MIAITYGAIAPLVLGFATIGLYLFYFAYRYNMLYVSNADIDTKGMIYPRALQQTTVGCYLLMICLIGLFAISTASDRAALGPLVLMILFLVFCVLYHFSLIRAVTPLLLYLPKNLEAEEEALLAGDTSEVAVGGSGEEESGPGGPSKDATQPTPVQANTENSPTTPAPPKEPNFIVKFFRPDKYADYATLRKLVPRDFADISYTPEVERDAYHHPAISSQSPLLWIPRDIAGVSRQEIMHTSKVIPITDEDATLDENNKIAWNEEKGRPPIYEEKIYY